MPTLADVSTDAIRDWLVGDSDPAAVLGPEWIDPSADAVDNIGRFWVSASVHRVADDLIGWLRQAMRADPDAPDRPALLALLKAAAPRLPWRRGTVAIRAILDLGGAAEKDYFERTAGDPTAPDGTRQEADSVRRLIERQTQESTSA